MLRDAAADLLLGSHCLGCGRPGRLLCEGCRDALPAPAATVAWLEPARGTAAVPVVAAAPYDGVVRDLVVGHKERGLQALARPLGDLLAEAVAALACSGSGAPPVLVPVPSRAASVRARGHDPTARLVRQAGRRLGRAGTPVLTAPVLRLRPGVLDQAGLDHAGRAANLAGSMVVAAAGQRAWAARHPRALAVVCDDVHTSGATAREAVRALAGVGVPVLGVAVVAATPLRARPGDRGVSAG